MRLFPRKTILICPLLITTCVASLVAFIWIGLALAWGAAGIQLYRTIGSDWRVWEMGGVIGGMAWTLSCIAGLSWIARHRNDRTAVVVAAGGVLTTGMGWVWFTRCMSHWPMDSGLFRWVLDRLAEYGWSSANLEILATKTDCALWIGRALPLYPLRVAVGFQNFALAVQSIQAMIAALSVLAIWRTVSLLFNKRVALWTVMGWSSMPGLGIQAIGLNHQVWAAFYFLLGIWALAEWMQDGSPQKRLLLAIGAWFLLPALMFAGYIGKMFFMVGAILVVREFLGAAKRRRAACHALIFILFLPGIFGFIGNFSLHSRIANATSQPLHGGQLAFWARGWNLQFLGEYSEDIDCLESLTPASRKKHLFVGYLASQCAYNGPELVTKLFPAKFAKFMLAGYAGLGEEVLWANGAERAARVARGMRVGWFVLFYSPLMLWGLWRLAGRCGNPRTAWLVVPVAMFGMGVMFAGETSPRYSMPVQALLLAAGAYGIGGNRKVDGGSAETGLKHPFAMGLGIVVAGYLVFAMGLLSLHEMWQKFAFSDMRAVTVEGGMPVADLRLAPFVTQFPDGGGSVKWPGQGGSATAYLYGKSWHEHARAGVETASGNWREVAIPGRVELQWEKGEPRCLTMQRITGEGPLHIGYADVIP